MLYTINLRGQTDETASYEWTLGDDFFQSVESTDIQGGEVKVKITVTRKEDDEFHLDYSFEGEVRTTCDRCLQPLMMSVEGEEGEDVTLQSNEDSLDVAWSIYEMVALSLPMRRVHADGACEGDMAKVLEKYLTDGGGDTGEKKSDPRWDALKEILNNN